MNLTVQYAPPTVIGVPCGHCDDHIIAGEDFKYVKFILGGIRLDFHEACFLAILAALNKFDQIFIKDRAQERGKKVH